MSAETAGHADHFGDEQSREHAAHVGMWIFLSTEVLLFASLFTGYAVYRLSFPVAFAAGRAHMAVGLGTLNTYLLVTASIFVALSIWAVRGRRQTLAYALLIGAALLGLGFLGVKSIEYRHHFEVGALPGQWFHLEGMTAPGSSMFFTVYFLTTGLHGIHVAVGVIVLVWLAIGVRRNRLTVGYTTPLELGGMYWHLVDIIWLFLWPMLYLV